MWNGRESIVAGSVRGDKKRKEGKRIEGGVRKEESEGMEWRVE